MAETRLDTDELREAWSLLPHVDRAEGFRLLTPGDAEEFFVDLAASDQYDLLLALSVPERRLWLRVLAPDDAADLVQQTEEPDERQALLSLLDDATRREVTALLAYEEDEAGGLMSSRFARVRPGMTADEAVSYLRRQATGEVDFETFYYVYVLDGPRLVGVMSFRELLSARGDHPVRDFMNTEFVTVPEELDQEEVARLFADYDVVALPVVDEDGTMVGIVTVDDIVDVVQEEATEDVQKYGGMEALDEPYMRTSFFDLVRKRIGWLALLAVGELLTASALGFFESTLHRATFLTLFIPLIISSGGNSGSQASTLVIRAMAMGEVRLRDWWRVARREVLAGLVMGTVLGMIGFLRVVGWQALGLSDQPHNVLVATTVGLALVAVVVIGTMAGSMLPFLLRRLGFDPASASAPLVATLVDVTGLIIYFVLATMILSGTIL